MNRQVNAVTYQIVGVNQETSLMHPLLNDFINYPVPILYSVYIYMPPSCQILTATTWVNF